MERPESKGMFMFLNTLVTLSKCNPYNNKYYNGANAAPSKFHGTCTRQYSSEKVIHGLAFVEKIANG
jgi:hypothetical protein